MMDFKITQHSTTSGMTEVVEASTSASTVTFSGLTVVGDFISNSSLSGLIDTNIISTKHSSVLMYNSGTTKWENNNPTSHMKSVVISSWTLLSNNNYYYDFTHNLGTLDLLWNLRDTVTNSYILPTDIVPQNTNVLRVFVGDSASTLNLTVSDAIYGITNTPSRTVVSKTLNYTATTNDIVWSNPNNGIINVFLPNVSNSANFPVSINNIGTGGTVVVDGNGANINGLTGFTLYPHESIEFYSNGLEWRQHN